MLFNDENKHHSCRPVTDWTIKQQDDEMVQWMNVGIAAFSTDDIAQLVCNTVYQLIIVACNKAIVSFYVSIDHKVSKDWIADFIVSWICS